MAVGRACLALRRFAAPRPSFCFVLFLDKTGDERISHKYHDSKWPEEQAARNWSA